ncbi:MAG: pyruvate kinase, partial [Candidatus Omnitrophota bacterium]
MPNAKIICTLGPASEKSGTLLKMMRAGMDVVRLNFSHGTHAEHLARIRLVRELNKKYHRHVRVLGDLEGYRIRIGRLAGGIPIPVSRGQVVRLVRGDAAGEGDRIPFDYEGPLSAIKKGQRIYIDDGTITLVADGVAKNSLRARVLIPGSIKERKGVNMPGLRLDFKGVTAQDESDLRFCVQEKVDFIAQSFVRTREDILILKKKLGSDRAGCRCIAKIENPDGIRNIDEIIKVSDGIMIARGDMGISIPIYQVPMVQKMIIKKCNRAGKFVITATQMLESMTASRIPTRAEVSDV